MKKEFDVDEIKRHCNSIRREIVKLCYKANPSNTHLGGCMSVVEILAVLYLEASNIVDVCKSGRAWEERDRVIISKGHAGIALYAALKQIGVLSEEDVERGIRGEESILFRHPKRKIEKAIECSSGSLGMGLGYAVGLCKSFKLNHKETHVYVIIGDGECEEGNVWESAMYAAHHNLNNLTIIIDKNNLQLDGATSNIIKMENMAERWGCFGFCVKEIDGHNVEEIYEAFQEKTEGPKVIIANTTKGKGISYAENRVEWHDNRVTKELYQQALEELSGEYMAPLLSDVKINIEGDDYIQNKQLFEYNHEFIEDVYKYGPKDLVGYVSEKIATTDDKFLLLYSDCGKRINVDELERKYPLAAQEVGIAEQNQICMAAGLADENWNVFATAYAPFITARVLDQVRAFMGYMKSPIKLIGLSSGLALGDLGATHTALEDLANMRSIPGVVVISPADQLEIVKAMEALSNYRGTAYLRLTESFGQNRVYKEDYEFEIGKAVVLKEGIDVAIISCGSVVSEVKEAAELLEEKGISCRVINMHTIKPLDLNELDIIKDYKLVVSVEEHNIIGGLGTAISEYLASFDKHAKLIRIGVEDKYFCADFPIQLRRRTGLLKENIVKRIEAFLCDGGK